MFLHLYSCYLFLSSSSRLLSNCKRREMDIRNSLPKVKRSVNLRLCNVSSYKTELLEICSDDPKLHVLFIPGNPGIVSFYKDFLESLYELLGGTASVTAIGHISHTKKNWEHGRLFSLQQQIDHKVEFIEQELKSIGVPIVLVRIAGNQSAATVLVPALVSKLKFLVTNLQFLSKVGHSIGAYISIETLRRSREVKYFIGLYPFLMLNPLSEKQTSIKKIAESSILSALLSLSVASLGVLPRCASRIIVSNSIGMSWSTTAVEAACSHLLQYHTFRNMIFMALTEFRKLSETPDWEFMRENQSKIAFLFGVDDHWGPLEMFEEIGKQVPGIALSIEREGHMHSFCCTEAGSVWVAQYVAALIKNQVLSSSQ